MSTPNVNGATFLDITVVFGTWNPKISAINRPNVLSPMNFEKLLGHFIVVCVALGFTSSNSHMISCFLCTPSLYGCILNSTLSQISGYRERLNP